MADFLRSDAYRSVIRNLRAARERSGMLQADLSVRLGKAENYISRIETAERRIGIVELVQIARALDIDPPALFAEVIRDID